MTSEAGLETVGRSYGEVRFGSVRMGVLSPSSLFSFLLSSQLRKS